MTEETKRKLSESRKRYLAANPDKHVWRRRGKQKSVPCEKLKEFLNNKNIKYVPEFIPLLEEGRFFSIDITFPDRKIGIEVNGNQHYDAKGNLKPYYQERHNLIEAKGWKLYEVHYKQVFNPNFLDDLVNIILISDIKQEFDYLNYEVIRNNHLKSKKKTFCSCCHKEKLDRQSILCVACANIKLRKVSRPSKDELKKLLKEKPKTEIGKIFGVSDNTIKNWCKYYDLNIPDMRGYWTKLKHNKL